MADFFYGYYEKEIIDLIKRPLKKDFYAFDVGANIGSHTLIMSSIVGENGKVIAIESHPKIFGKLIENLRINRITNVQALECALQMSLEMRYYIHLQKEIPMRGYHLWDF